MKTLFAVASVLFATTAMAEGVSGNNTNRLPTNLQKALDLCQPFVSGSSYYDNAQYIVFNDVRAAELCSKFIKEKEKIDYISYQEEKRKIDQEKDARINTLKKNISALFPNSSIGPSSNEGAMVEVKTFNTHDAE